MHDVYSEQISAQAPAPPSCRPCRPRTELWTNSALTGGSFRVTVLRRADSYVHHARQLTATTGIRSVARDKRDSSDRRPRWRVVIWLAGLTPGARQRRQAGDGACGHAAATAVTAACHSSDGSRPSSFGPRRYGRGFDVRGGNTANRRCTSGVQSSDTLPEWRAKPSVWRNVFVVQQVVANQYVHHRQRQRTVGAGLMGSH